jgi:putative ABC transport system ATP-binding protein
MLIPRRSRTCRTRPSLLARGDQSNAAIAGQSTLRRKLANVGRVQQAQLQSEQTTQVVAASGVSRRYGEGDTAVTALNDVSVEIERGKLTAVMGPSGSGKSTLMHILAGLDRPTEGSVLIDGIDITQLGDDALTRLRRDKIGFVFQFFNLLPMLTARENILLPMSIAGREPDPQWFDTVIDETGLRDRLTHRPAELSGGQQQRVAIARALLSRPAVLFADEPTGNLDSTASDEILQLLRRSVDSVGQTVVMVTHDPIAAAIADRILFLSDGRIVKDIGRSTEDQIVDAMKGLGG